MLATTSSSKFNISSSVPIQNPGVANLSLCNGGGGGGSDGENNNDIIGIINNDIHLSIGFWRQHLKWILDKLSTTRIDESDEASQVEMETKFQGAKKCYEITILLI